jgi:hypothetical protein
MAVIIDGNNTPTAGGIGYGDGTELAFTSAGSSGQALLSAGAGVPTWGTPTASTATTATNLAGGFAGGIPYQSAPGTTAITASGSSGQVLTSNGTSAPTWGEAGTATNIAGGSNGTIPYQSASGTTQMLAVGSAGQVLQTNGAGAPSWVTPGGGSLIFLSTVTASNSATVDIETTFNSTYENYILIVSNLRGTSASAELRIRFKLSGGYSSADYSYHSTKLESNVGTYDASANSGATQLLAATNVATGAANSVQGNFYIYNPSSTTSYKAIHGVVVNGFDNSGSARTTHLHGANNTDTSALTGLRFFMSVGNISAGTFRLYGIKNS